jgi:hypothetical protein
MASFAYTDFKRALLSGEFDLHTGGDDIRVLLVMTDTTADTEQDDKFVADITTLDEFDGSGYSRQALANEVVAADAANDRGEFDADNTTFATLGAGTRQIAAAVIYKHVTNDADSLLIAYVDSGGFPITANGGDIVISWNAEGILQAT